MRGSIIPEPLAMPPTRNVPCGVATSTAADFGNGSVVMIASAASAPPSALRRAAAAGMPVRSAAILRFTPMTPVDATRTSVGAQPSTAAVSAAISRASARPCGPVQALAQPLLVTTARARLAARRQVRLRHQHRRRLGEVQGEDAGGGGQVRRRRPATGRDGRWP